MKELFRSYLYNFIHPIKSQEFYYLKRNGLDVEVEDKNRILNLKLSEVLVIAWLMAFFTALYSILGMKMGISFYLPQSVEGVFSFRKMGQVTVFKILLTFIFYPVGMWIWLKVVAGLMKFTASIIGTDEDLDSGMKDVISGAMSPTILYLLPVIGVGLVNLLFWFYCGVGLVKNLRFSVFQTLVILVSPVVLFSLMMAFIVLVGVSSLSFV